MLVTPTENGKFSFSFTSNYLYQFHRLLAIASHTLRTFVFHASIVKPLGESGKLQLTSDMTELEFALNAFVSNTAQSKSYLTLSDLGSDFKLLRAMR